MINQLIAPIEEDRRCWKYKSQGDVNYASNNPRKPGVEGDHGGYPRPALTWAESDRGYR